MHDESKSAPATWISHRTLARVRQLGQRRHREIENRFWIEGIRNFIQASDAGLQFDTILISSVLLKNHLAEKLSRKLAARGVKRLRLTPEEFRGISTTARASGIGAIVAHHWTHLENAQPRRGAGWLVLEDIRSPGNLGTILRTAEACGMSGVIFLGPRCDPFDPAVVRASMGGIFHLQLVRTNHEKFERWAQKHAIQVIGVSPQATRLWTEIPQGNALALVLGEERSGMSERARTLCGTSVRLPMSGKADSLNVGVAAGVMMYELVRRGLTKPPVL